MAIKEDSRALFIDAPSEAIEGMDLPNPSLKTKELAEQKDCMPRYNGV